MAVKTIPIEPGITQVVDGVTRLYRVEATVENAPGSKKRITQVRAFPVDANGNKLKGAKHLYRNGVWAEQELTTLTEQQQKDFHNRIQLGVGKFAKNTNAHIPPWAANPGSNTLDPANPLEAAQNLAGGIQEAIEGKIQGLQEKWDEATQTFTPLWNAATDPFGQLSNVAAGSGAFLFNSDTNILTGSGGAGGNYIRYPANFNAGMDTLKMTCFRYRPPYGVALGTATPGTPGTATIGNIKRNTPFKERVGTIELPMPGQIVDSTSAGWEVDYMNDITIGAAQHIGNKAGLYGTAQIAGGIAPNAIGQLIGGASKMAVMLALYGSSNNNAKNAIGANVLSMLGSNLGFDISADQILSRGGGIVSNSNAELMFRGVNLRTFQMMYRMVARSPEETRAIRQIIRAFKQWSAPRKLTTNGTAQAGDASFFLGTPNIFQLVYMTTDPLTGQRAVNTHVHKFKPCALTNFSVNYAPSEQWLSYEGGAPVAFNLNFQFSELEPIYNTDFTDNIPDDRKANPTGDTGTGDLIPISAYDVGY